MSRREEPVEILYDRMCDPTMAYLLDLDAIPHPQLGTGLRMVVHPDTDPAVVAASRSALLGQRAVDRMTKAAADIRAMLGGKAGP